MLLKRTACFKQRVGGAIDNTVAIPTLLQLLAGSALAALPIDQWTGLRETIQ